MRRVPRGPDRQVDEDVLRSRSLDVDLVVSFGVFDDVAEHIAALDQGITGVVASVLGEEVRICIAEAEVGGVAMEREDVADPLDVL